MKLTKLTKKKIATAMLSITVAALMQFSALAGGHIYNPEDKSFSNVIPSTQTETPSGNYSIYVGKRSRTLTLYDGTNVVGSWPCNVGTNSNSGDKVIQGDSVTPSGSFYVCTRNDESVCYLALGISYPSSDDADRGYEQGIITMQQRDSIKTAIENRQQPDWETPLGGYIEIHGNYTENGTTHGCVAVDNQVMDILWKYCELGTTITVGP